MRICGLLLVMLALTLPSLGAGAQHFYACFYSRSAGQDLELNLLNVSTAPSEYQVRVYDAWGDLLWEVQGQLNPFDAAFYRLGKAVEEGDTNWGVVSVVSQERLVLGLEYSIRGQVHSIDIVDQEVAGIQTGSSYLTAAYHTNITDALTSVVVMNPWDQEITGHLVVYKSDGSSLYDADLSLSAHESTSLNLAQLVGHGSRHWGLVEVITQNGGVVLACKYLKGHVLQVENVIGSEVSPGEGTPAPAPYKED